MKLKKHIFLITLLPFLFLSNTHGQNIDSLLAIWDDTSLADTTRLGAIDQLAKSLRSSSPDSAIMFAQKELVFAQHTGHKKWEANSLNYLGIAAYSKGDYSLAQEFYLKYLELSLEIDNKVFIGKAYNNIGTIYHLQEDFDMAIFYYLKSIKIRQELDDKEKLMLLNYYMGNILINKYDYEEALIYNQRALNLSQELESKNHEGELHHTIGWIYEEFADYDSAIYHYHKSLDITVEIKDSIGIVYALDKIGVAYSIAGNYNQALEYHFKALAISKELKDSTCLANNYRNLGNTYYDQGLYDQALSNYFESLKIRENLDSKKDLIAEYNNIGNTYVSISDLEYAARYYLKAIDLCDETGAVYEKGNPTYNLGTVFWKQGEFSKAIDLGIQSLEFFRELNDRENIARVYNFLGDVFYDINDLDQSLDYISKSIEISTNINNPILLSNSYEIIGRIFIKKRQFEEAISCCQNSLKYANENLVLIRESFNCFYESYKGIGDSKKALKYYEKYISLVDSLEGIEVQRRMLRLEYGRNKMKDSLVFESEKLKTKIVHQEEVNKKTKERNLVTYGSFGFILLAGGLWSRLQIIRKSRTKIKKEKDRAEELLLNILPSETAEELKQNGYVEAKKFNQVTVLFTDFKEFTKLSENIEPEQLVRSIDFYYKAFDQITSKFGLEKIKTIGDSYMCAGGLPTESPTHAKDVVYAGKEMVDFVEKELVAKDNITHFEIRIGIHSGPVVAGIVGIKKWQYDIWGDTVNIAARMETNSEPGKVNISETTFNEIKNTFICKPRGEIEVKNRGKLKMFFVEDEIL